MADFGLIGKDIGYSFSKTYFTKKFEQEKKQLVYENFDIPSLESLSEILNLNPDLKGLNVTIPYKEKVLPFLDEIDSVAASIGAVNTIKIGPGKKLKGYNTDWWGFRESLKDFLPFKSKTALILGTGGASKAIAYTLGNLGFAFRFVSRNPEQNNFSYEDLDQNIIEKFKLIINCTPLGTYPDIENLPPVPYHFLTADHLLYDLTYNPSETLFLKNGKTRHAKTINGLPMLELQAEKSWEIWNS